MPIPQNHDFKKRSREALALLGIDPAKSWPDKYDRDAKVTALAIVIRDTLAEGMKHVFKTMQPACSRMAEETFAEWHIGQIANWNLKAKQPWGKDEDDESPDAGKVTT